MNESPGGHWGPWEGSNVWRQKPDSGVNVEAAGTDGALSDTWLGRGGNRMKKRFFGDAKSLSLWAARKVREKRK